MAEQIPAQAGPETEQREPAADEPTLHVASGKDETKAKRQEDAFDAILGRGDLRDQAAERRDRAADGRDTMDPHGAWIDRDWSGRDRDAAAADRADLIELLQSHDAGTPGDEGDPVS
jgi:hypothetical protein